jgi:hypothetical protein
VVIHTNFAYGKTLLIDVKYLYVNCNNGSRIFVVEWVGVKMLVCINFKLGHFNGRIFLPKESLKPITCMDI